MSGCSSSPRFWRLRLLVGSAAPTTSSAALLPRLSPATRRPGLACGPPGRTQYLIRAARCSGRRDDTPLRRASVDPNGDRHAPGLPVASGSSHDLDAGAATARDRHRDKTGHALGRSSRFQERCIAITEADRRGLGGPTRRGSPTLRYRSVGRRASRPPGRHARSGTRPGMRGSCTGRLLARELTGEPRRPCQTKAKWPSGQRYRASLPDRSALSALPLERVGLSYGGRAAAGWPLSWRVPRVEPFSPFTPLPRRVDGSRLGR